MAIIQPDPIKLVHTMAHALRHDPGKYGLEPDAEGWVSFDDLIIAVRFERNAWLDLTRCDIERVLNAMESDRFEIVGAKIRAVYGHSINLEKPPPIQNPPEALFHGTSADNVAEIMAQGLLRMSRRFVHLSSDFDWVLRFIANKERWVVFRVLASVAGDDGVAFRQANRHVWLVDAMSPEYLHIESSGMGLVSERNLHSDETSG
jgi:putative RNA 2'-phosphotransferase